LRFDLRETIHFSGVGQFSGPSDLTGDTIEIQAQGKERGGTVAIAVRAPITTG